jgi:Eukaryotic DNA topoisomerase I, catalytic core
LLARYFVQYVFLAATSEFKANSDLAKYEKARKLKDLIGDIRRNYEAVRAGVCQVASRGGRACEIGM